MAFVNFAGLASGIDTSALIKAVTEAARARSVTPNLNRIENLQGTNTALKELKSKFSALQSLSLGFASLNGGALSKMAISSNENVLTASASKSAPSGTYNVNVEQLAKNGTISFQSSAGVYQSADAYINKDYDPEDPPLPGLNDQTVIKIGSVDGSPAEQVIIENTNSKTLNQFVTEFNQQSLTAQATVVNAGTSGSPDYRIVITSNSEGTEKGTLEVELGPDVAGGIFDTVSLDQATNARFSIAGIGGSIERASNTISDVLPGISFSLQVAGDAKITVSNDSSQTVAGVQALVDAFNDIVKFINDNNKVVREENGKNVNNIFGSLAATRVDNNALSSLRSGIISSSFVNGGNTNTIRIFADLGITTNRDGTLELNTTKLEEALKKEPNSVNNILQKFGDTVAITNGSIAQFTQFNGLFDRSVKGNERQITNLNDRIARAESTIAKQEAMMIQRFSRLEAVMSRMQNQQASLFAALQGLGFNN